jgi:hypothetical protein
MIPPDDDSKQAAAGCEVDLKTRAIRFLGCEDQEAMIRAAEHRLAASSDMIGARSGFTNRDRRALNQEIKILRRWLSPDAKTPEQRRRALNRLRNQRRAITTNQRRKTTKRRAREARRDYREQRTLQKRPDYAPPIVLSIEGRERLRRLRRVQQRKQAWFERKHGREVNETACRDEATETRPVCAETAHVAG